MKKILAILTLGTLLLPVAVLAQIDAAGWESGAVVRVTKPVGIAPPENFAIHYNFNEVACQ